MEQCLPFVAASIGGSMNARYCRALVLVLAAALVACSDQTAAPQELNSPSRTSILWLR